MTEATRIRLIRECFTQLTREVLDDVIHLARAENQQLVMRVPRRQHGRHAAASTYPADEGIPTLQEYIEALPVQTQRELTAWMLFGREPYGISVHDIEAVCSSTRAIDKELAAHLASKTQLADYLERARKILGI